MTKEQKILLEMTQEIHSICKENNITYFLSNRLALAAFQDGKLDEGYWYTGQVLMTSENLNAFIEAFNNSPRKDREIEWMGNNENFPGPFLRYINSETACYTPARLAVESSLGIYITIELIRYAKQKQRPYYDPIENAWRDICYGIKRRDGIKLFVAKTLLRFSRVLIGKKRAAAKLNAFFLKACQPSKDKSVTYIKNSITEKKEYFDSKIFSDCKEVSLCNQSVNVPVELEKYIKTKYGTPKYKTVGKNIKTPKAFFICDPELSYKEIDFQSYRKTTKKIFAFEQENLWKMRLDRKKLNECFHLMKRTFDRYYYGKQLLPRKKELQRLLATNDPQLYEDDFWKYRQEFNVFLKKGLNLYIDEDIQALLSQWYTQDGKLKQAKKTKKNLDDVLTGGLPVYDYDGNYISNLRDEYKC